MLHQRGDGDSEAATSSVQKRSASNYLDDEETAAGRGL